MTDDSYLDLNPLWSPDGRLLYFTSDRGGNQHVWRVAIDEESGEVLGAPEAVTSGAGVRQRHLSISRDGRYLAFSSLSVVTNIQKASFDPNSGALRGEPEWVTTKGAIHPDVSPDGEWLAFDYDSASRPSAVVISVIRTDGTGLRQLTDTPHRDRHPVWSPDGKRLAFRSNRSGSLEFWVIDADGGHPRQITRDAGKTENNPPLWLANGDVAVHIVRDGTYLFDAEEPLSEKPTRKLPPFDQEGESWFYPWSQSPDGRWLAGTVYGSACPSPTCLAIYSLEAQAHRRLADSGDYPRWISDSRLVYQSSGGVFSSWDIATGRHSEVLSAEILGIAPDRIRPWPTASLDGQTLYFERQRSEGDIWLLTLDEPPEEEPRR